MKSRLKQIRKDNKLTQLAMAEALNVSKSSIEAYEYGRATLTDRMIKDICREFKVNEIWFRTGEGNPYELSDVDKAVLQAKEALKDEEDVVYKEEFIKLLQENLTNRTARIWYEYAKQWIEEVEKKKPPQ